MNDEAAEVQFRYNTDCFKVISKLAGATYLKEEKRWRIPLIHLPRLLGSPHFDSRKFRYEFDVEKVRSSLDTITRDADGARNRALSNPFSVKASDIKLLSLDVVITESVDGHWISLAPVKV